MRWVALVFVVGCHAVPGQDKKEDCTILCRCLSALPGEQAGCVQQCTADPNFQDSELCTACVDEHATSCPTLVGTCLDECEQQVPTGGMP